MQMATELAKGHAADLRRLADSPSPRTAPRRSNRRLRLPPVSDGWAALWRAGQSLRHSRQLGGPTCAP